MYRSKLLISALLLILLLSGCTGAENSREAMLMKDALEREKAYETAVVIIGTVYKNSSTEMFVSYTDFANINCGEMAGTNFVKCYVMKNSVVKKGDLIAEFEIPYDESELKALYDDKNIAEIKYNSGLAQKQAAIDSARSKQAECEEGSAEYKIQAVKISAAVEDYNYYVYEQKRQISAIQEKIDAFEKRIANNKIYSPMDGIVKTVYYLSPSTKIEEDTQICQIYSAEKYRLAATTEDGSALRYNSRVKITMSRSDAEYYGQVISVPAVAGKTQGSLVVQPENVRAEELGSNGKMILASINRMIAEDVLIVPAAAIQTEDSSKFVSILENGVVIKRYVKVGISGNRLGSGENVVQISDGLTEGDVVIIGS